MKSKNSWRTQTGTDFKVKELFKEIFHKIKNHFSDTSHLDLVDLGSATGELLYYLKRELKTTGYVYGIDNEKTYVKNGNQRFGDSGVEIFHKDIKNFDLKRRFDVITITSLLSVLENPFSSLDNILNHLKQDGLLIISGMFSEFDIQVKIEHKLRDKNWDKDWNGQWFMVPVSDYVQFFDQRGYACKVSEQIMPFDLEPKKELTRSWTIDVNGIRTMTNGMQIIYQIKILEITKKDSDDLT